MTHPAWALNTVVLSGLKAGERFQALVDEAFADVGVTLCNAAIAVGADATCTVLPEAGRPLVRPSQPFLASLAATDVVVMWFAAVYEPEFAGFRKPIYDRIAGSATRFAFGARMDQSILDVEMSADYRTVQERSASLYGALRGADRIRVTTPAGTDCTFDVTGREWHIDDGWLRPGQMVNLPAGEVFIAPLAHGADGVCVIDRSIALQPVGLVDAPVRIVFDRGRVVSVEGGSAAAAVRDAIAEAGEGADVVAELGIGTNERARITGAVITDEKVLGTAHVAFGDNTGSYGGDNKARIHVDCVMADATIEAGGRVVLDRGR